MGAVPAPSLKLDEVSPHLRVAVWNLSEPWLFAHKDIKYEVYLNRMRFLFNQLHWPIDEVPAQAWRASERVKDWILQTNVPWHEFYHFVELLPRLFEFQYEESSNKTKLESRFLMEAVINERLLNEGCLYRFLNGKLAPITNEAELQEIRKAVAQPGPYAAAAEHIELAISHLSAKPEAAYNDCVKQAVSAVESTLWVAVGEKGKIPATLQEFGRKYGGIATPLRLAIEKLYGYASNEDGVRHAATAPGGVSEAEARFMLVTCSAVMNFLILKAQKPEPV